MAVTAGGTPYVESSDLVANYPGASLSLANRVDQVIQAPTQNAITSTTYTAALLDAGKTVTLSNASAVTLTIPAQATVAWVANTQLNFLNIGVGTVTITPAATVTINGTPLTLATSKGGSLVRTASNTWTFIPFSGIDNANFTNAGTNYSSGGISYKFITFTGSGDLIVDQAGFADVLCIGGGGGASMGGGGAGSYTEGKLYLEAGTYVVTVGGGGARGSSAQGINGTFSSVVKTPFALSSLGGGGGGWALTDGSTGGSGGGAGGVANRTGGISILPIGNNGGNSLEGSGDNRPSGGGGGASAVGANGVTNVSGNGGAGRTSSITNVAVGRAGGGGGGIGSNGSTAGTGTDGGGNGRKAPGASTAGAANTGGGGGGDDDAASGSAGGSGVVIVRVVV